MAVGRVEVVRSDGYGFPLLGVRTGVQRVLARVLSGCSRGCRMGVDPWILGNCTGGKARFGWVGWCNASGKYRVGNGWGQLSLRSALVGVGS